MLSDSPENETQREQAQWRSAMVKANSEITLTLFDEAMAQFSSTVDDDSGSAKDLREALNKAYRTANEEVVIKIERELENLTFRNDY